MNSKISRMTTFALTMIIGIGFCLTDVAMAEENNNDNTTNTTSISLSPTSNVLNISSKSEYTGEFDVTNHGENNMKIEVYAAPYSYTYSESNDSYQQSFNNENNFTQITRWITFKDSGDSWVKKPNFTVKPNDTLTIHYKVSTPENIPAGGQYAVIFVHTLTSVKTSTGINTEISPGLLLYGRSTEGETIMKPEIVESKIEDKINEETSKKNVFYATAKIKNSGNIDFNATGLLTVTPIIGGSGYSTENDGVKISVIPESELSISDEWEDSPDFGIYKISWTVTAGGETQTVEKIVFINPLPLIIIVIIVLTAIITWVIIMSRKRKERNARLTV